MKKRDLIAALKGVPENGRNKWRGQSAFALFFADWLERLDIPEDGKYDFWNIDQYVPQLVVDAFEDLRTGDDEPARRGRAAYEAETGHEVPNLTELGASPSLDQAMTVQTTGFMLAEIVGRGVEQQFDAYANAQRHALQAAFDRFLRLVYRRGLYGLIRDCRTNGMSGAFGGTELRSFACGGRLMFTFARRAPAPGGEISVSFVAGDDDPTALSAGIQSEHASLAEAMSMIEDVVSRWPADQGRQAKLYKADGKIGLGI